MFRAGRVRGLIDAHLSRRAETSRKLWALLQLELWFRSYVDGERRAAVSVLPATCRILGTERTEGR